MPEAYMRYRRNPTKRRMPKVEARKTEAQSLWETRIVEGEIIKEAWGLKYQVNNLEQAYYGSQRPDTWTSSDWFTINLIFSSLKILRRNVCPRELKAKMDLAKSFILDPQAIQALQSNIRVREAVLQHYLKKEKLFRVARRAYMNAQWQFGVVKVGYNADMQSNENWGSALKDSEGGIVFDEQEGTPIMEPEFIAVKEDFFIDLVDPDNLIVNRHCPIDLDGGGRWVAEKIFVPLEEVKADSSYSASAVKDLGPSALYTEEIEKMETEKGYMRYKGWEGEGTTLPENEFVVLYEIYDLKRKETLTIARGGRAPLREAGPLPPGVDKHPYVFLRLYEQRNTFYPIPGIFNWMGPATEYNLTRNQSAVHRKRFNRKYLYIDGKIDVEELDKLEEGGDGTYAKANAEGAIEPLEDAPLDRAVYGDSGTLRTEFMEMTGVGDLQRSQTGAESATEAEIVERRAREGEIDEHEEMMDFISEIVRKLHSSMEANLTLEGAIEHIGPAGKMWMSFGPEHFEKIAGEVIFEVEAEVISRMTLQVERAQLLQLLDILGKNPLLLLSPVLLRQLVNSFPALASNELLIQHLEALGQLQMRLQARQGTGPGNKSQVAKQVPSSSGSEASNARKVAS